MKKLNMMKMYKQPEIDVKELAPQTIICASIGEGDPLVPGSPDAEYTD